jgi:predicted anti-sigma-YlaC factor YlaD
MSEHNHEECRRLLGSMVDYLDGSLDETLCHEIEHHMSTCENCRIVVDTLRKTVEIYQTAASQPDEMPEDVRERLFLRLNLKDFTKQAG